MKWYPSVSANRLLLIYLEGASSGFLHCSVDSVRLPILLQQGESSVRGPVRAILPASRATAWATLQTGCAPEVHGVLAEEYLDHSTGQILPVDAKPATPVELAAVVRSTLGDNSVIRMTDRGSTPPSEMRKPCDLDDLSRRVAQEVQALQNLTAQVNKAARTTQWQMLEVKISTLERHQHFLGDLLGVGGQPTGNRHWVAKAQEIDTALDHCLEELFELGKQQNAAVLVVSPQGFLPFRERIMLPELFCRRGLLMTTRGVDSLGYRLLRVGWKWRRTFRHYLRSQANSDRLGRPVRGIVPIDFKRTRAVTLHGRFAALVYLNRPERFGYQVLTTKSQREQALAEAVAALNETKHPVTGESLFVDVYQTEPRFGCDPLQQALPEVVGIVAPGFHTRHRLDRRKRLLLADPSLSSTRGGNGLFLLKAPGLVPQTLEEVEPTDIAPIACHLLGVSHPRKEMM